MRLLIQSRKYSKNSEIEEYSFDCGDGESIIPSSESDIDT